MERLRFRSEGENAAWWPVLILKHIKFDQLQEIKKKCVEMGGCYRLWNSGRDIKTSIFTTAVHLNSFDKAYVQAAREIN